VQGFIDEELVPTAGKNPGEAMVSSEGCGAEVRKDGEGMNRE
jgi:hypothetical protein